MLKDPEVGSPNRNEANADPKGGAAAPFPEVRKLLPKVKLPEVAPLVTFAPLTIRFEELPTFTTLFL